MTTTIRIKRETKKALEELGHKGETFDDLVKAGAIELKNKQKMHIYNVSVFNGETQQESYIELRVPKNIRKLAPDKEALYDALLYILEENNIKIIDDPRTGVVF